MIFNIRFVVIWGSNTFPEDLNESIGGGLRATLDLASALNSHGNKVQLLCYNLNNAPSALIKEGLELVRVNKWGWVKLNKWSLPYYLPLYYKVIKERVYDIDHVTNYPSALFLPKFGKRVVHIHDVSWYPTREHVYGINKTADAVICCSNFVRKKFLEDFGYPPEKTFTVYNGINPNECLNVNGNKIRKKLSIDESEFVILYVGQISRIKGLEYLIRAFENASRDKKNLHLIIGGSSKIWPDNREAARYESRIRQMSKNKKIHFLGAVARDVIFDVYAACDIFVFPSIVQEGFPLVILEAMGAGKPILATRVGGVPELVTDGVNGLLVPPKDVRSLEGSLLTLIKDEKLRKEMGRNNRKKVKDYTWGKSARKVQDVYSTILED